MSALRIRWTLKGDSVEHVGDWDSVSNYTVGDLKRMEHILNEWCSTWQIEWK